MSFQPNSPAARDVAYVLHPYTNARAHEENGPMIITKGDGVYVYDDGGKQYLEAMAGLWCASLGFNEDRLVKAATKQMETLPYYHTFAHKAHLPGIDLAEKLINLAPVPMSKVFFAGSGSEANDTAMKLVWYYNNARGRHAKKKMISRVKGYHGVTIASASLTGTPVNHPGFDLPIAGVKHTSNPHYYRFGQSGESEEDFATRMAQDLENMILEEGPETVAAFIAEPIMGAGGVIVPPKTYFAKIQAVLKKYDVLLIADEVICGFGRTGEFWGSQTMGMKPDILTCAKALSSAYLPISAVMISEDVYQPIADQSKDLGVLGHGYTYTAHPVCAAVALETLRIYEEDNIVDHVKSVAPLFEERLAAMADHELVGEARGRGLMGAVELVADKETRESFDPKIGAGAKTNAAANAHGLIIRAIGDSIAMTPPLIITESQINEMFDKLTLALNDAAAEIHKAKAA
ncbi:aspartate aminotransferase family protein [Thalassobaculum sp. OXR-137]|uniref:aspartate aminotransferase family protein n=1 Tax=Thalassobaculum sp. OXR-137 TaxID=3100173 RepID=UPI002AC9E6F1|nr:aspartate aminotransferase family protein [Thalassobaculum sp. OXR-137]WPZ36842.1 aspartate aminotransferase family protein [Thalassobaculum sp. OXR-137]